MKDWFWYRKEKIMDLPFHFMLWRTAKRLRWSCRIWDLIGHETCEKHGFCGQSYITGKCKHCDEDERRLESGKLIR